MEVNLSDEHNNILPYFVIDQLFMQQSQYFEGSRRDFSINLNPMGTDFQNHVWRQIQKIPYGETESYKEISIKLNKPKSFRAIGSANAMNKIAILIPCHRVIGNNGNVSGYSWGVDRKKFLINLEKNNF